MRGRRGAVFAAALCGAALGCAANPDQARRALEAQGFVDIELGGYPWLQCSDLFNSAFRAHTRAGTTVTGAVCCGPFSCVVRVE